MIVSLARDTKNRDTNEKRRNQMKMETENKLMQPKSKECLEPPEAKRGKEEISSRPFSGSVALLMP